MSVNPYEVRNLVDQYIYLLEKIEDKEYAFVASKDLKDTTAAIFSKARSRESQKEDIVRINDLIFDELEGVTDDNAVLLKKIKANIKNLANKCLALEEDYAPKSKKTKLSDTSLHSVSATDKRSLKRKGPENEPTISADTNCLKKISDIVDQYIALIESRNSDDPEINDDDKTIKFHLKWMTKKEIKIENIITIEKLIDSSNEEGLDTGKLKEIKTRINNIVKQLGEDLTKGIYKTTSSAMPQKKSDEVSPSLLPENLAEIIGFYAIDPHDIIDKLEKGDVDSFDKRAAAEVLELDLSSYKGTIKDIDKVEVLELVLNSSYKGTIKDVGKVLELFHNVKILILPYNVSGLDSEAVANFKNIQSLDLSRIRNITDADLARLAKLENLRSINLTYCYDITDAGLAHLTNLKNLQSLNLSFCNNITDAGLAHLTNLRNLQSLDLSHCWKITNAGLAQLTNLENLQSLIIEDGSIKIPKPFLNIYLEYSSDPFAWLEDLKSITSIDFSGIDFSRSSDITDEGLVYLKNLSIPLDPNLG